MKAIFPVIALVLLPALACKTPAELNVGAEGWSAPSMGAELQVYPAGVIAGARFEWESDPTDVWFARVAYNRTDRHGWGEHDDETGSGFGLGAGWRRWKLPEKRGWHYGARLDFWALEIDWRQDSPVLSRGSTDVIVAQPSVEGGYSWKTQGGLRLDLTLGLGAELNIDTDGEDVGEGAILLIGFSILPGND